MFANGSESMNGSSQAHYDQHLGSIYLWMVGGAESAKACSRERLENWHLIQTPVGTKALAVDLGCGPGLDSIVLAEAGFRVVAVDNCDRLLDDFSETRGDLPIEIIRNDLVSFRQHLTEPATLILCLGDTLTHLRSEGEVAQLLHDIADALGPRGRVVLTFRDYVSRTLEGAQRFIPVRQTDDRLLTCFLEYHANHVLVHDLIHERINSGWQLGVSSYRKLRLDRAWVAGQLHSSGLQITRDVAENGMITLMATKL